MPYVIDAFNIITALVALASAIAAATDTPKDDALVAKAYKLLGFRSTREDSST